MPSQRTTMTDTITNWAYTGSRYTMHQFPDDVKSDLKKLQKADNWHVLAAWMQDVVWMASCVLLCYYVSYWFYPLAVLIIGARQRGLSTLLHDCAHGVGIANRRLQMAMG